MSRFLGAAAYAFIFSLASIGATAAQLRAGDPGESARVIAVFAPAMTAAEVLAATAAADGALLRLGRAPWIAEVQGLSPGFRDRLGAAGAWMFLDAERAAALCGFDVPGRSEGDA